MTYILDFCASCGVLLPVKLTAGCCDNCGEDIMPREKRIQGEFSKEEAKRLLATNGDVLLDF